MSKHNIHLNLQMPKVKRKVQQLRGSKQPTFYSLGIKKNKIISQKKTIFYSLRKKKQFFFFI